MDFSLFYFADHSGSGLDRYRLLLQGARFADDAGFAAVWTPERHFHEFGGLYPNPAVTGAAVAAVTRRIGVRAGSVVAPLHHPARIAEEWSVIDNLSGGRAGISFASGWHATDFALRPENFADRRDVVARTIEQVRRLWRGEPAQVADGRGEPATVHTFPTPIQPNLPAWLTSSGNIETFRAAGRLGTGVLTHLLGQDLDDLPAKIGEYRRLHAEAHGGPGHVVLMLHTFLGTDRASVRETVYEPFSAYLRSSLGLWVAAAGDLLGTVDPAELDDEDVDFLIEHSFDRFFDAGGLFGTVDGVTPLVRKLAGLGVDELACLIDFVPDADAVLGSLKHLAALKDACRDLRIEQPVTLPAAASGAAR